jgi:hypothetical protein
VITRYLSTLYNFLPNPPAKFLPLQLLSELRFEPIIIMGIIYHIPASQLQLRRSHNNVSHFRSTVSKRINDISSQLRHLRKGESGAPFLRNSMRIRFLSGSKVRYFSPFDPHLQPWMTVRDWVLCVISNTILRDVGLGSLGDRAFTTWG